MLPEAQWLASQGGHEVEQRDPPGAVLLLDLVGHHQEQGHVGGHVLKGVVNKPGREPPAEGDWQSWAHVL